MTIGGMVLRRADYSLSDEQRALREALASLLAKECPGERVRLAEPIGFDEDLWRRLRDLDLVGLGVSETMGGQGAGLVELALVAEEIGRCLAPVPFVECAVLARMFAACGGPGAAWRRDLQATTRRAALALFPVISGAEQLVPAGAIAEAVVALMGDRLVVVSRPDRPALVPNLGRLPLARWGLDGPQAVVELLAEGSAALAIFERALREWKLLTAAAQVGIADRALELAVDYARDRCAFGVPIGSFQAVSHPLADCHIAIVGARRLVWKAAWFADHEPDVKPELIPMALAYAAETAARTTAVGIHTLGGMGFTAESDMQLYFRRAKGWANVGGDPGAQLQVVADALFGLASA